MIIARPLNCVLATALTPSQTPYLLIPFMPLLDMYFEDLLFLPTKN